MALESWCENYCWLRIIKISFKDHKVKLSDLHIRNSAWSNPMLYDVSDKITPIDLESFIYAH